MPSIILLQGGPLHGMAHELNLNALVMVGMGLPDTIGLCNETMTARYYCEVDPDSLTATYTHTQPLYQKI